MTWDPQTLQDFSARWHHARRAALRVVLPDASGEESEADLLAMALVRDCARTLRGVFDNSLKLGAGFARFYQHEPTLEELPDLLAGLGTPCLPGTWAALPGAPGLQLSRPGCPASACGAEACDYFREAVSGLCLGLCGVLHGRHASLGHGDPACVDVFYATQDSPHRFGPIPADMREAIEAAARLVRRFDSTVEIDLLGVSEGVLYYHERRGGGPISTASQFQKAVQRRFPRLLLRELSPRSVFAGENPW